jgi:hypothetical protein
MMSRCCCGAGAGPDIHHSAQGASRPQNAPRRAGSARKGISCVCARVCSRPQA